MQTFVIWFVALLAVVLTAVVVGWALFEMVRKTEQRKEYFAALVGLLGTMVGTMLGAAVQELRVQDKQGEAREARAVAVVASDAARALGTQLDTVTAVLQRTPAGQAIAARDLSTLRSAAQVRRVLPSVPPTWRGLESRERPIP